jgi:hypothetical protein
MQKTKAWIRSLTLIIVCSFFLITPPWGFSVNKSTDSKEAEVTKTVKKIFDSRARALVDHSTDKEALSYYFTKEKLGSWAHSHEKAKLDFVQQWVTKRGVNFIEARSEIKIPWLEIKGDQAELIVNQTLQIGYVYKDETTVNRFGIGTRHWMKLKKHKGKWLINQDFYTDGLGDDSLAPNPTPADGRPKERASGSSPKDSDKGNYDREAAVRYADQYAGMAWGAGNNHQYNLKEYGDLSGLGGDCANYVSQCLADKNGGKIPLDGSWFYTIDQDGFSGSEAWVRAQNFCDWLQYSGRGSLIAQGTFSELIQPAKKFPAGAVGELKKGDVIGYGMGGEIEHVAIVVGWDSNGYPLVNSHTVDRYHCPWDMGYDKKTIYYLFHVTG